MKLYTFDSAPNPRRVNLLLKYKGISLDSEQVNLREGQQFSAAYRSLNPRCTVPLLCLDDDVVLSDTIAICLYLDRRFPEQPLFGANDLQQAQVVGLCHRIYVEGFMAVADVLRNGGGHYRQRALPGPLSLAQIPALVDRGQQRTGAFLDAMNLELEERQFLMGDSLSQADIDLLVVVDFCGWVDLTIPAHCAPLRHWLERTRRYLGQ